MAANSTSFWRENRSVVRSAEREAWRLLSQSSHRYQLCLGPRSQPHRKRMKRFARFTHEKGSRPLAQGTRRPSLSHTKKWRTTETPEV